MSATQLVFTIVLICQLSILMHLVRQCSSFWEALELVILYSIVTLPSSLMLSVLVSALVAM
ncbi:MAG: hypothetical protein DI556_19265 [Rhodovulum sulfidophilum]|uniref:Uncharacterized protein n=1 Tax=Rhodovulum sulfidophilum TaxID=35806 RepID=A0A2W5MZY3_RHOSU|nr:MAG: hypothetical protein DI556_19265 [Rhodovulum sulfidophilum]